MAHKSALLFFLHRCVILAFCLVIMIILLLSATLFIKRQQANIEQQSLVTSHALIKQMAWSLVPLINDYNNSDGDDTQQISSTIQQLAKQDWLLDISLYMVNGRLIASAGETVSTRNRLGLDDTQTTSLTTDISTSEHQLITRLDHQGQPLAFIRFTVDDSKLMPSQRSFSWIIRIIWGIIILSALVGFILATLLHKRYSSIH